MSHLAWHCWMMNSGLPSMYCFVIDVRFCDAEPEVIFGVLYHLDHLNVEIICLPNLQIRASSSCGRDRLVSLDHVIVIDAPSSQ
jgi:hypothetical protein